MKPFIHLFETPTNHYFYDVNRNENVRIEQDLYEYLYNMMYDPDKFVVDRLLEEQLKELQKRGYLSENRVKEIKHPANDMIPLYLNRKLNQLVIQLTHNCNLRCSYCPYTSNDGTYRLHQKKTIDFETIRKAIIYLRDRAIDNKEVIISFYGGEPLIEAELIKKTVDFCKEELIGKHVKYNLTTNGTLFTDEILELFETNDFRVIISLDGPKEINDKNRKFESIKDSVFDRVIRNIEKIESDYRGLFKRLSINMVIDPTQDFDKYKMLFEDYTILNDIFLSATIVDDDCKTEKYKTKKEFLDKFQYSDFLIYLDNFCEIEMSDSQFLKSLFNQKHSEYFAGLTPQVTLGNCNCPSGTCIPGKMRYMVNVDGVYYVCEKISEKVDRNAFGTVNDGFDIEKTRNIINVTKNNIDICKDCFAFRHCKTCLKSCHSKNEDRIISQENCIYIRNNFHNQLIGIKIIEELINGKEIVYE